ncbi:MAG: cupin domain-containing protein [Candidatus Thermoplasmatota archaeon]|nr:cupin domain-containing protein [Candidatus Thermoplasmatota archaeon]
MIVEHQQDVEVQQVEMEGAKDVTIQWLIDEKRGAPTFAMRRFVVGPGGHTPLHEHAWEHEVYVLDGEGALVDENGGEHTLEPHRFGYVPAGETHQFRNTGSDDFVFLCMIPLQ